MEEVTELDLNNELNLVDKGELTFKEPDLERFPCLAMAYDCGIKGGILPAVMNAANEIAVKYFLKDRIRFCSKGVVIGIFVWNLHIKGTT